MALGSSNRQLSTPIGLAGFRQSDVSFTFYQTHPIKVASRMLLLRGLRREEGVSARLGQSAVGGATAQSRGRPPGPPGHVAVAVRLRPPPARWLGHRLQPAPPGARLGAVRVAPHAVRTRVRSVRPSHPLRMGIHGWRLEEARRSTSPGRGPGAGNCLAESRRTDGRSPARFHAKRSFRCRRSRI